MSDVLEKRPPFERKILWIAIFSAFFTLVLFVLPLVNTFLQPRSVTETANVIAQLTGTFLWSFILLALVILFYFQFRKMKIAKSKYLWFVLVLFIEFGIGVLLLTFQSHGALYWDSFSVIRLTAEGTIGDWRSFLFDSLVMYLMNIWDNVYIVPISAVLLFCTALNIPILFSPTKNKALLTTGISICIFLSSYFISNVSALFTDTFFASFTVLWTYSLYWLSKQTRIINFKWNKWHLLFPELPLFIVIAIPTVLLRHNGWVTGIMFLVGLIFISSKKLLAVAVVGLTLVAIFSVSLLKNPYIFPESMQDSSHTNRNYQQIALVLNTWGAFLSSDNGYNTPNLYEDLEQISLFVAPDKLREVYTPITSIPAWEAFALPWRTIDDQITTDFMYRTIHRVLENLPLFVTDKTMFISSMLTTSGTPERMFEKDCSVGIETNCPIFGTEYQNYKYFEQVRAFTLNWPEQLNINFSKYLSMQFAAFFVFLSASWFVFLLVRIKRNVWTFLIGLTGLANIASLLITVPSPEYRYFFSVVCLALSTILMELNGMNYSQKVKIEDYKIENVS